MYTLKNQNGMTKTVKNGFSWSMLFLGVFVPLSRGDWKWFAISLIAAIATGGVSWIFFPFFYNKVYLNDLLNSGYEII